MAITEPAQIHPAVVEAFNAGDIEALVALYEPDARMVQPDGSVAQGVDAIRDAWQGFIAMRGQMTLRTRFVVEMDDIALLRNDWSVTAPDMEMAAQTAEVARRQADGSWRYIIDHPFGASDLIA